MAGVDELSDIQAEAGIVATLVSDPKFLNFSDNLDGSFFYDNVNGALFDSINSLFKSGIEKIDTFNIMTALGADKKLKAKAGDLTVEEIGEIVKRSKLIARTTSAEYIKLVGIIMGLAYRRNLYRDLDRAQTDVLRTSDITLLQRSVAERIDNTTSKFIIGEEIERFGEKIDDLYEETMSRATSGGTGYKINFIPALNKYLTIEKNEMISLLSPAKGGKSCALMNIAWDCINQGAKVLYLDTEMSDRLFSERLICHLAQVSMRNLKAGILSDTDKKNVEKAKNAIKDAPFWHKYIPIYTNDDIYGIVKTMQKKYGCDLLIFDYLKAGSSTGAYEVYAELGVLCNLLKNNIAGDLGMYVVAACQASKGGGIADSIRIGQYSSAVIKIRKKTAEEIDNDGKECGNYLACVILNRLGPQDIEGENWIDMEFFGDYCTFSPCKQHEIGDIFS